MIATAFIYNACNHLIHLQACTYFLKLEHNTIHNNTKQAADNNMKRMKLEKKNKKK